MARAMEVVGDRWSILILREAYYGVKRFDEFQNSLVRRIVYRHKSQLAREVEHGSVGGKRDSMQAGDSDRTRVPQQCAHQQRPDTLVMPGVRNHQRELGSGAVAV